MFDRCFISHAWPAALKCMCPAITTEYKIIMYKFTLEMEFVFLIHHRTVFSNAKTIFC